MPPVKWEPVKWPTIAAANGLVLTGWGPDMPSLPTREWADRKKGGLIHIHWERLVERIPVSWFDNPYYKVPPDELPLALIRLEDFLHDHPGKFQSNYRVQMIMY